MSILKILTNKCLGLLILLLLHIAYFFNFIARGSGRLKKVIEMFEESEVELPVITKVWLFFAYPIWHRVISLVILSIAFIGLILFHISSKDKKKKMKVYTWLVIPAIILFILIILSLSLPMFYMFDLIKE